MPVLFSLCYRIEFLLYVGSEVVVHDAREELHEEVIDHCSNVFRQQFALLAARHLFLCLGGYAFGVEGIDGVFALLAFLIAFRHVFSLLYGGYCRRVG